MKTGILCILLCFVQGGCAVRQLHRDQDQLRSALLELYTDQIMDNLIRASNNMPIVQMDYTNAQGSVSVKGNGMLSGGKSTMHAALVTFTTNFMASLSGERTNQVTVTGTPVTTHNEVYTAYLEFLDMPGSLLVSECLPPAEAVHIYRKEGDKYYWVPIEYNREFMKLSLLTTVQRGQSLKSPEEFYTVIVTGVASEEVRKNDSLLTLQFDKSIPNDSGYLKFINTNSEGHVGAVFSDTVMQASSTNSPEELPNSRADNGDAIGTNNDLSPSEIEYSFSKYLPNNTNVFPDKTKNVVVKVEAKNVASFKKMLPKTAHVYLYHSRPQPPTIESLLDRANFQLQQIQFNQLRSSSGP